ncbi:MAG: DUF2785 domain-containing protein [Candidatus Izimaplasma sp.]|nr:DUF2785 domain-containing protein [Candidatus Izimaplasma bacterium]
MDKEFIELLKKIKESKFEFDETIDKLELANTLIKNIGNNDSFVRDGLIYPILATLLYYDHFSKEELVNFTKILIGDKGMKYDIPNYYNLSVLTRSFSLLAIVIIIYRHRTDQILSKELFRELYTEFMDYFRTEEDFRGYIKDVGWAHSVAHSADVFKQLFRCDDLSNEDFKDMLEVIRERFMINSYVFMSDEDERMVTAIHEGLKKNILDEKYFLSWIDSFRSFEKIAKYPEDYNVDINIRNLLRSLYFRLIGDTNYSVILAKLVEVLDELNTHKKAA